MILHSLLTVFRFCLAFGSRISAGDMSSGLLGIFLLFSFFRLSHPLLRAEQVASRIIRSAMLPTMHVQSVLIFSLLG